VHEGDEDAAYEMFKSGRVQISHIRLLRGQMGALLLISSFPCCGVYSFCR